MSEKTSLESDSGGIKAKFTAKFKKRPDDSPEKKRQQLQDYTAWVNNYLKRKAGAPLVRDLRRDLGDGVIFVHLVEVVAKAQVAGVERWPTTIEGQRLNIERSLEYLRSDGVMLHTDASRDLFEGNVKGVMKVILAIAERYQPKSVKPRTEPIKPNVNNTAPIPDNQFNRQDFTRPYTHPQTIVRPDSFHNPPIHSSTSYPTTDPAQEAMYSSPIDTLPAHKPPQVITSRKKPVQPPVSGRGRGMFRINEDVVVGGEEPEEGLSGEIGSVVSGLGQFKAELLQLHAILLRNNNGIRDVGGGGGGGGGGGMGDIGGGVESVEREREFMSLQERVSQLQDEITQTEVECATLRTMVEERNAFITTMKSEIYRKEYLNDTQKAELHTQLLQKDTHIKKLETELVDCHGNLESKGSELERVREELEVNKSDNEQIKNDLEKLKTELTKVSANEEKLSQRLSAKEKKLVSVEEKLSEEREKLSRRTQQINEDLEILSEGITGLTSDPKPEQLESVKKKLAETMSHLELEPASPSRRRRKDRETDDHTKHRRKKRTTAESASSPNTTRILYYVAGDTKSDTPFVAIVTKKASDVTLGDFKEAFGRHGNYRFFFKNEDPDCGVVKEELTVDEQLLPSYRGRVTAWIQEKDKIST